MNTIEDGMSRVRSEWKYLKWPEIDMPFTSGINPHAASEEEDGTEWAESMGLMSMPHTRHCLEILQPVLAAAHHYPAGDRERLHFTRDLMSWVFVLDDRGEQMNKSYIVPWWEALSSAVRVVLSGAVYDKSTLPPLARALADLVERASSKMSAAWGARFRRHIGIYFDSYFEESVNRANGRTPSLYEYIQLRRKTSALWLCEDVCEYVAGAEIPEELYRTPEFQEILFATNDITSWKNDIDGFVKEVIDDSDVNNLVAAMQAAKHCSWQEAMDDCGRLLRARIDSYMASETVLLQLVDSSNYSVDTQLGIRRCLEGYRSFARGYNDWAKLTKRYARIPQPENGVSVWR